MSSGTLARLSYDAAVRALDVQERGVEQLRGRTGTLLAASSLTASFLGAQTIQRTGGVGTLVAFALIALAASIVLSVYVLLPKRGFVFSISAPGAFETLYDVREDEEEVHRRLVYWLEEYWTSNQEKIEDLGRYFFAAAVALTLQLVFWAWALPLTSPRSWQIQNPHLRRRPLLRRPRWRTRRRAAANSGSSPSSCL